MEGVIETHSAEFDPKSIDQKVLSSTSFLQIKDCNNTLGTDFFPPFLAALFKYQIKCEGIKF